MHTFDSSSIVTTKCLMLMGMKNGETSLFVDSSTFNNSHTVPHGFVRISIGSKTIKNTDDLNPTDDELLAAVLGSPARRVLTRAELLGPRTGWRDGHLSSTHGFCPPDPGASQTALSMTPGSFYN